MQTEKLREIRHWLEPVAASVYFTKEPNERYAELGLNLIEGYFCSRSAAMGKLPGPVVASVFGFFRQELATTATDGGWAKAEPEALIEARFAGAAAALRRLLKVAEQPRIIEILRPAVDAAPAEGRPLYAAWLAVESPEDPVALLWHTLDLFREHRGAGHLAAWTSTGLGPLEASMLTEAWWGIPLGTYARTFGWSKDDFDRGEAMLEAKGLVEESSITVTGQKLRDEVENLTDRAQTEIDAALADDAAELAGLLEPLANEVMDGGGYPFRIPHPNRDK